MTQGTQAVGAVLVAMVLAGCTTPYSSPTFQFRPPAPASFEGIAQLVEQAPGRSIDVVMVHGMCTHGVDWANDAVTRLSVMLGGPAKPAVTPWPVPGTATSLHRAVLETPQGTVHATAVLWSPVVEPLKAQMCFDQSSKSPLCQRLAPDAPAYPYQRARLNRELKDGLLNDCLADAIIYQGKSRGAISAQLQMAVLAASTRAAPASKARMLDAAATEARPIAFISESLGSKIAFDAIVALQNSAIDEERAAGRRLFDRFEQIFMGANQLPILSLGDQDIGTGTDTVTAQAQRAFPGEPLSALLALKRSSPAIAGARQAKLQIVAFTDPNDLLSYALHGWKAMTPFDVADVIVSNEWTLFGYVERPDTAHSGYRTNTSVTQLIACGTAGCPPRRQDGSQ